MAKCYVCESELTENNKTVEHIILNSIGGKLKSYKLICKECNSNFGSDIDFELSKQLNYICNMLNIERDRGMPQTIDIFNKENGEKWLMGVGGKPIRTKPIIREDENNKKIEIIARDMKEANKIIKGFEKKYPQINANKELKKVKIERKYLDNVMKYNIVFGGEKILKAICKMAVNFYMYQGGNRKNIENLIPYIKTDIENKNIWFCNGIEVLEKGKGEVFHSILVEGIKNEKFLYAYVELFNVYKFIIILNSNYLGENSSESYSFDVIKRIEVERKRKFNFNRNYIETLINNRKLPELEIKNEINELLKIITKKQNSDIINKMSERAVNNSLRKYPEDVIINEDMFNELMVELEKEFVPWIINRMKKN